MRARNGGFHHVSLISRRRLLALPAIGVASALVLRSSANRSGRALLEFGASSPLLTAESSPVYDQSFAAFASQLSVAVGDELIIRARSARLLSVAVHRVGSSRGSSIGQPIEFRTGADARAGTGVDDVSQWPIVFRKAIDESWRSGLYVAVVTDDSVPRARRFAPFVVRDHRPVRPIVVQIPFTTYHAYNAWGGASLYPFNSPGGVATSLPISRPFDVFDGAGFMFYGDWQMARWLDREQYDVSYVTSYDLHRDPRLLDGASLFATAFHDEYWSTPMRSHLEDFVAAGGNAAFFAANSIYWRIRLNETTMTCHKVATADEDPHDDTTGRWRDPFVGAPEHKLLGSHYESYEFPYGHGYDWTVASEDHWLYDGTGLRNGDRLQRLVGYEWDNAPQDDAEGVVVVSRTQFTDRASKPRRHEAVVRTHPGGGIVVNVGTTYWPRFLEGDDAFPTSPQVQRMTANVLERLGRR